MNFNVIQEKHNPVLKRKEMVIGMDFGRAATPSRADLQDVLGKDLKAEERVEITKITTDMGMSKGKAWIKVWDEKKVASYRKAVPAAPAEGAPTEAPKEGK